MNPFFFFALCCVFIIQSLLPIFNLNFTSRNENNTNSESQTDIFQFAFKAPKVDLLDWSLIYVLIFTICVQVKADLIWSDSRILRKLRFMKREKDNKQLTNNDDYSADEKFSQIYIMLSRGRHHKLSRTFGH